MASTSRRPSRLCLGVVAIMCVLALLSFDTGGGPCVDQRRLTLGVSPSASLGPTAPAALRPPAANCPRPQDVTTSAWADSCTLLTNVCVDQGNVVLYDEQYQPGKNDSVEPPQFSAAEGFGQFVLTHRNGYDEYLHPMPTIHSRGASTVEGTAYLRDPVFSNCTVPVVMYPLWMSNFGHFLRDNAAKLFGFIDDTPWKDHIKLVQMTAEGLGMPSFNYQLLQPMTPFTVESWADFTTRLPPGAASLLQPGPPPSAEGDHQRCFRHMFVCTHGLNITRWPLHEYGRHVVRAYSHMLPPEVQEAAQGVSRIALQQAKAGTAQKAAAAAAATRASGTCGGSSSSSSSATVLNVVFQKRDGGFRQLLNSEELVQQCNSWQYCTAAGRGVRAKCWEEDITDLRSGISAALTADVMVGMHGANLANGWLMRNGSSMIEVQAYGFDQHVPHLQDPLFNARDTESQVLWWVLMGCDPDAFKPSPQEAEGTGTPIDWIKNRNMVLRWEALDTALQQVAETGGSMQRYWQLWDKGEWWWHVHATNVTYGGHRRSICSR